MTDLHLINDIIMTNLFPICRQAVATVMIALSIATVHGTSREIHLTEPGTLSNFISNDEKYEITELILSGPVNGADMRLIRDMAGEDPLTIKDTPGILRFLNMHEAYFVGSGPWFRTNGYNKYYLEDLPIVPNATFSWLPSLRSVYLPKVTTEIKYMALNWSENLEYVNIPVGVKTIGHTNFTYADNLTTISFPSTVTSIATDFYESDNLRTIYCYAQEPPVMTSGFSNDTKIRSGILYVPKGSSSKYWRANGWSDFPNIIELDYVKYAMKVTVSAGGSISYDDSVIHKDNPDIDYIGNESFDITGGDNVVLNISPDDGYFLEKLTVNGVDMTEQCINGTFTIQNVNEVLEVNAYFGEGSGIIDTQSKAEEPVVKAINSEIIVNNLSDGELVTVYSLEGFKIATARALDGKAEIELSRSGLYIVHVAGKSYKIIL